MDSTPHITRADVPADERAPTFGALLHRFRVARGWTQEELAERAHLSPRSIVNWENGATRRPQREPVRLIADALGLSDADRALLLATLDRPRAQPTAPDAPPAPPDSRAYLPAPLTPLLARDAELAAVTATLARADARLMTIIGPGGVGKTRIALAAAAALADAYADGVSFVSLAPVRDPELLWPAVAQALGVKPSGAQTPYDALRVWLRERRALLVLDNFEHLLSEAVTVANLLMACARVTVLATSRAPLRLRGEQEFPLAPLALPHDGASAHAAVAESPAVRVFTHYARAVRPDFRVTPANAAAVAAICARLDGLPLALELAAARMRTLTAAQMLSRLTRRLPALVDGPQDVSPRQQTMRGAIAWSDGLLAAPERRVFVRFAVFAGGATPDAVAAVCGDGAEEYAESLVEQNLLTVAPGVGDAPRYGMLETVREYAWERAQESGEAATAQQRHAAHFLAFAEAMRPDLRGHGRRAARQRITAELDNLRAALRWAQEAGDVAMSLRFTHALQPYWRAQGYLREGAAWAQIAIEMSETPGPDLLALRANALVSAGNLRYQMSEYAPAVALAREGLAIARAQGDERTIADALWLLGIIAVDRGELERARGALEESLALFRHLGRPSSVARVLHSLANEAYMGGDHARAIRLAEESRACSAALGEEMHVAIELSMLARIHNASGDPERALTYAQEADVLFRRAGEVSSLMTGMLIHGDILRALHREAEALALYDEAIAIARDVGAARSEFWGVMARAEAYAATGDYAGAAAAFARGLAVAAGMASTQPYAPGLEAVAFLAHAVGQHAVAATLLGAAHTLQRALGVSQRPEGGAVADAARRALGGTAFTAAWEAGAAMPLDDAVAHAKVFLATLHGHRAAARVPA